ncbi:hypothetical protein D3C84_1190050 [compost metagenome]
MCRVAAGVDSRNGLVVSDNWPRVGPVFIIINSQLHCGLLIGIAVIHIYVCFHGSRYVIGFRKPKMFAGKRFVGGSCQCCIR